MTLLFKSLNEFLSIALLLVFLLIVGCSSSDTGAVLPSSEVDSVAPQLIKVTPVQTEAIPANATIQFDFREVLDKASLAESLQVYARKNRDIYSSAIVGSSDFIAVDSDLRDKRVLTEDRLITVLDRVVLSETVDEDGVPVVETVDVVNEVFATRVLVEPGAARFPLSSVYSIVFSRQTKDVSQIDSIDPVTNELTTGNFLEAEIDYSFTIGDGSLQPGEIVNTSFLSGSNFVGTIQFESLDTSGFLFWEQLFQGSSGDDVKGLFSKGFDYDLQEFDTTPQRVDYIAVLDGSTTGVDSAVLDTSSDSLGNTLCAAWTNQDNNTPPFQQSIMVRCGNGVDYGARIVLNAHLFGPQVSLLKIILLSEQSAFVSYVYDGVHYMYKLLLSDDGVTVSLQDSETFGSGTVSVRDVAFARSTIAGASESVVALVSIVDSAAAPIDSYQLVSNQLVLDSGVISLNSSTLETSDTAYNQISIGFDQLGTGLGGWLQGGGSDQRLFTSRFDGTRWQSPVGVVKDGRGPINEGGVHVFEDGQAVFFWVQDIGSEEQLKVQGLFSTGGGASLSRPPVLTIASSLNTLSSLKFSGDREGNGVLFYELGDSLLQSIRFLHNTVWDDAWGSPELVSGAVKVESASVGQILEDGRMVFAYPRDSASYDSLETRIFSDYQ